MVWAKNGLACGIDEVGRGCLAGPVVAAAVILPKNHVPIMNVRDSKKLAPRRREALFTEIVTSCTDFGVGLCSATEIDEIGIVAATKRAMLDAIGSLVAIPDLLLIDAMELDEIKISQKGIVKGDESCYSISCASIIAKVIRDRIVMGLDHDYPNHGFSRHKGYGTRQHIDSIRKYGKTPEHRETFLRNI